MRGLTDAQNKLRLRALKWRREYDRALSNSKATIRRERAKDLILEIQQECESQYNHIRSDDPRFKGESGKVAFVVCLICFKRFGQATLTAEHLKLRNRVRGVRDQIRDYTDILNMLISRCLHIRDDNSFCKICEVQLNDSGRPVNNGL
jgi:hypothetical protein